MTWKVIIADDEAPARERLRRVLARVADVAVVAECADGRAALLAIRQHVPHLAILDISMPGLSGPAVVAALAPDERPGVIFVSAHPPAAAGLGDRAAGFVRKPYSSSRLLLALDHALAALRANRPPDTPSPARP